MWSTNLRTRNSVVLVESWSDYSIRMLFKYLSGLMVVRNLNLRSGLGSRSSSGFYVYLVLRPGSKKVSDFSGEKVTSVQNPGRITAGGGEGGGGCHFLSNNPQLVTLCFPQLSLHWGGQCSVGSWWGVCIGQALKGGGEDGNDRSKDLRSTCCSHQRGLLLGWPPQRGQSWGLLVQAGVSMSQLGKHPSWVETPHSKPTVGLHDQK